MENKEQLLNLIATSFLPEGQKKELSDYLISKEAGNDFFDKFNGYLITEFKKKVDAGEEKLKLFDKKVGELDLEMEKEEEKQEKELTEKLSGIDEMDIIRRNEIWEAQDNKLEQLRVDYEKKLFIVLKELLIVA